MSPSDHAHPDLTLADYLAVVRRHKWVILITTIIVPLTAYFVSAQQAKVFSASSEVLLSRQDIGAAVTGIPNASSYSDPERYATTQAALARVPEVARRAIARAGVKQKFPYELLESSSVSPRDNADLLRFTVRDGDPEQAASLATAYGEAFTAYKLETETTNIARARKDLEARLRELRQQGAAGSDVYRNLLEKAQDLRTIELLQSRASVVRPARVAAQVEPTPRRNAMLGGILGLVIGLAIAFVWNAVDRRIHSTEEVERALGLPLLARLPRPRRRVRGDERLAMLDDPSEAIAEATRRLRTNLELANVDKEAKTIMITSSVPFEGKSTTIANLAVALARSGRTVALVDLDLRQPAIADIFNLRGVSGITDVALGRIEVEDALTAIRLPVPLSTPTAGPSVGTAYGRLRILPAGPLPPSPGEFVGTQAVSRVLQELRARHDYVLIDAPPMLAVGDAMTISTRIDAILVVVRLGVANRPMLGDLARGLEASPAHKLGFVLTGVDDHERYGGAGYGYYVKSSRTDDETPALREVKTSRH
ncbi:MAG: polysaccharide biosynthesis tyrosine autokinase [Thermoleophilia bacterium]|nr:polysaccharide biosynthesis tyrosine autokinase [Thermoleophilia bacterium]MDH5281064.1 polysaccharide biosynthesis tyrosine autokinase [Thermoleophilia bacterium]